MLIIKVGSTFERWTVIAPSDERTKSRGKKWVCRCSCGKEKVVSAFSLRQGQSTSCGCKGLEKSNIGKRTTTHGKSNTKLYRAWKNMKGRCFRPSATHYHRYGGRGITVCDRWKDSFENFRDWALASGYKEDLTLDRKDEDGDYTPSNCQWITNTENIRKANKRHLVDGTGGQSREALLKRTKTNRERYGIPIVLEKVGESIKFYSIGEAADYLCEHLGRERKNVYSHLKQVVNGRSLSIGGYSVRKT